jgi:hypothetical protein
VVFPAIRRGWLFSFYLRYEILGIKTKNRRLFTAGGFERAVLAPGIGNYSFS